MDVCIMVGGSKQKVGITLLGKMFPAAGELLWNTG